MDETDAGQAVEDGALEMSKAQEIREFTEMKMSERLSEIDTRCRISA
jgi:hypothetical protein